MWRVYINGSFDEKMSLTIHIKVKKLKIGKRKLLSEAQFRLDLACIEKWSKSQGRAFEILIYSQQRWEKWKSRKCKLFR